MSAEFREKARAAIEKHFEETVIAAADDPAEDELAEDELDNIEVLDIDDNSGSEISPTDDDAPEE